MGRLFAQYASLQIYLKNSEEQLEPRWCHNGNVDLHMIGVRTEVKRKDIVGCMKKLYPAQKIRHMPQLKGDHRK